MALGNTTYKTPNPIFTIDQDFTGKEGCGVMMVGQGAVAIATQTTDSPYAVITVGGESADGITYPGLIGGSSIELVDQLGCVVQVVISTNTVSATDYLCIDPVSGDGSFDSLANVALVPGDWVWGLALTHALAGEQCLMRFQPYIVQ